jgi:hypothetical protein
MPPVIAPRIEVGLVEGSAYEMIVDKCLELCSSGIEHVVEGVSVVLQPELVFGFQIEMRVLPLGPFGIKQRVRVRAVHDDVVSLGNRPPFGSDGSAEPFVPAAEAPVRLVLVDVVVVPVAVLSSRGAEPAMRFFLVEVLKGDLGLEHGVVGVEYLAEMFVDDGVGEEGLPEARVQHVNEESVEGDPCDAMAVVFGSLAADMA